LGIRNEEEHIEGCCCGGEGIFEKNNDEVVENFEENGESRGIEIIKTSKRKMINSSSFEISRFKAKTQDPLVVKLLKILPAECLWGGQIDAEEKYDSLKIVNTCTINYFLVAIAFSSFLNEIIITLIIDASSLVLMEKLDRIIKSALLNETELSQYGFSKF
jgi:hypothetical protein